jgi:hypothetical protein
MGKFPDLTRQLPLRAKITPAPHESQEIAQPSPQVTKNKNIIFLYKYFPNPHSGLKSRFKRKNLGKFPNRIWIPTE